MDRRCTRPSSPPRAAARASSRPAGRDRRPAADHAQGAGRQGLRPGTNPEELFAAGYAACFESALRLVARQKDRELPQDVSVTAEVAIGKDGEDGFALAAKLRARLPGIEEAGGPRG